MKIRVQVALEHGIMFLYDPYADTEIPKDTGAAPITATENCVCFQVASYVDGNADVILSDLPLTDVPQENFSSRIDTPSKHISLTDVPVNYYTILKLQNNFANIKIWNFVEEGFERSWVQITNLDLF